MTAAQRKRHEEAERYCAVDRDVNGNAPNGCGDRRGVEWFLLWSTIMMLRRKRLPGQSVPHIDLLCRGAELQGGLWARHGYDVNERLRQHAPHWPGDRRDKVRLIAACLEGARRQGGAR